MTGIQLANRLRLRDSRKGVFWALDLRGKAWGDVGIVAVRDPSHAAFPDKDAPTTSDRDQATAWLADNRYAEWTAQQLTAGVEGGTDITAPPGWAGEAKRLDDLASDSRTWQEGADAYLAALEVSHGPAHNTYKNHSSALRAHILPAFAGLTMSAVTKQQVREFLGALQVRKSQRGVKYFEPAMKRTKDNVRNALSAVWRHEYPDTDPPFTGIKIKDTAAARRRERAAEAGDISALIPKKGYTPLEMLQLLVSAVVLDVLGIVSRPNVAVRRTPNTAAFIALCTAQGVREDEALRLRWHHIDWVNLVMYVPGSKTDNAPRVIPLQQAVIPWLWVLAAMQGGDPKPKHYVIRTDPRRDRKGATSTYIGRVTKIMLAVGLKFPQKATHIFRGTFATWLGTSSQIDAEMIKAYLGHGDPFRGVTSDYIQTLVAIMPPSHRQLMTQLPHPAQVFAEALKRLPEGTVITIG